jgi:glycosyltransferase involved in cell wall biosynthesis
MPGFIRPAYRLMRALHGVVIPSYSEGLPMTLLEACILEKPVVATRVGSIPEVLAGYPCAALVQPGDAYGLAQAIETLVINGKGGCPPLSDAFVALYSSATMTERYSSVYKEVMGRNK